MIIPQTTKEQPYIEFIIDKLGNIKLSITSSWWGGIGHHFKSKDGIGNTCLPKDLDRYVKACKNAKIKELKDNIRNLRLELKTLTEQL